MKNKIWLFVCWLTIGQIYSTHTAWGQLSEITPPSPEAAAMMRSINIPVSHYTGTASINIPFYTIATGGIQIPITLSYQASGLKVKDMETWVGLGWKLSTGGRISRMVRGAQADEKGYSSLVGTPDGKIANDLSSWNTSTIDDRNDKQFDSEPDLFFFEIPGKSGQFVVDYNGKTHLIPYQGVQIEWKRNPANSSFIITDENGNRYYFEDIETTASQDLDDLTDTKSWISSWNLSRIITNQNDTIRYIYDNMVAASEDITTSHTQINIATLKDGMQWDISEEEEKVSHRKITTHAIYTQNISWNGGKIEFVIDQTEKNKPPRLTEIKLYTETQYLKSIRLSYGEFTNGARKLVSIDENNGELSEHVCHFEYNTSHQLPSRYSQDYDHWGYFNGTGSSKNQYYPSYTFHGRTIEGADRSPHWPQTMADMLTDIVYKGGGRKTFEYEANIAAVKYSPNQTVVGGGVRIKRIIETVDDKEHITEYQYTKSTGESSGEMFNNNVVYVSTDFKGQIGNTICYAVYENNQNLLFDFNGVPVVYSEVKEILPNGSYTINRYTSFNDQGDSSVILHYPTANGPGVGTTFDFGDGVLFPNSSRLWKRGLLIEQQQYTSNGELVHSQTNRYKLNAPAKAIIKGYIGLTTSLGSLIRPDVHHVLGVYEWLSQPIYLDSTFIQQGPYNLPATTTMTYDTTYLTTTAISQKDVEDNQFLTETTYPFNYGIQTDFSSSMQSALTLMQRRNIRAVPVETLNYKNGKIISGELCLFRLSGMSDSTVLIDQKLALKLSRPIDPMDFNKSTIDAAGNFTYDSRYETTMIFDRYDNWGNPTCMHSPYGNYQATIYGYNHSLPIAQVNNAQGGGARDYITSQVYSFSGTTSGITQSFVSNMDQTLHINMNLGLDSTTSDYTIRLVIQNTTTSQSYTYTPETYSQEGLLNIPLKFHIPITSGNYIITANVQLPPEINWEITASYELFTLHNNDSRDCEVFHTSFEDDENANESAVAKTGNRVFSGDYTIDLQNFIPGTYLLSYWESTDNGISWQFVQQTLNLTEATTNHVINALGKIIDEVRIQPPHAEMTTYTHLPGIGITSQTDSNGHTTYYEYDALGRLAAIRNNDRELLKSYQYQ